MIGGLPGWTSDLELAFKEILYRFLEEVHSTKAALYLIGSDGTYMLATQYGFGKRDHLAADHPTTSPLAVKVRELRSRPRAFNHPREFPEATGYLEGAGTARMLLVPLYVSSRILGFVDARDKGRRREFDAADARRANLVVQALIDLARRSRLYPELEPEPEPIVHSPTIDVVGAVSTPTTAEPMLDRTALEALLASIEDQLVCEGLSAVAMTVVDGSSAASIVVAGGGDLELDRDALCRHQSQVLSGAGRVPPEPIRWRVELRSASVSAPVPPTGITSCLALLSGDWALVFTVLSHTDNAVGRVMDRLQGVAFDARDHARLGYAKRALARRLLRPGEDENPELETHSAAVSRLSFVMARRLGWGAEQCEEAALAGLLHDVGMRDIDYDAVYRHPSPGATERRLYQLHVHSGERIVRGVCLEGVADAIRHHHERWDGKGYPDRLAGTEIPRLARLVHVAEVYDVLVSATSYRPAVAPDRALAVMRAAAGHQFDPEMVETLALVM